MLKTLSIRTGLLSLLAVMTLLLLIVSGIGIYALTQSSSSLQRINHLQGEQMVQLNSGYTLILRARNEAGQAVRMMEIGLLDDAAKSVKSINQEIALAQKTLKGVIDAGVADPQGQQLLDKVAASLAAYNQQGINPMLKALNEQSADSYYDLLESKLIPVAKQFDYDMQTFQMWSGSQRRAVEQNAGSDPDRCRGAADGRHHCAGLAGAAPHAAQAALGVDCAAGKRRRGGFNPHAECPGEPGVQPSERCHRRHAPVADALGAAGPRCQLAN